MLFIAVGGTLSTVTYLWHSLQHQRLPKARNLSPSRAMNEPAESLCSAQLLDCSAPESGDLTTSFSKNVDPQIEHFGVAGGPPS